MERSIGSHLPKGDRLSSSIWLQRQGIFSLSNAKKLAKKFHHACTLLTLLIDIINSYLINRISQFRKRIGQLTTTNEKFEPFCEPCMPNNAQEMKNFNPLPGKKKERKRYTGQEKIEKEHSNSCLGRNLRAPSWSSFNNFQKRRILE